MGSYFVHFSRFCFLFVCNKDNILPRCQLHAIFKSCMTFQRYQLMDHPFNIASDSQSYMTILCEMEFSTFCGLSGSTTYPYLPQRRIDPPRLPQLPTGWGPNVPNGKFTIKNVETKVPSPKQRFLKKLNPSLVLTYYLTYFKSRTV